MLDIETVTGPIVYILEGWGGPGIFKIGCTKNVKNRYHSKRGRAQIIHVVPVIHEDDLIIVERAIHRLFCRRNLSGYETFQLTPEDLKLLPRIIATSTGITLRDED